MSDHEIGLTPAEAKRRFDHLLHRQTRTCMRFDRPKTGMSRARLGMDNTLLEYRLYQSAQSINKPA